MAIDIFAKISTIKGESQDERHAGEIDVLSWSWGVARPGTLGEGGGGGAGKVSFREFNFTHNVDKASPLLMKACATGEHIKEATVTVRRAGSRPQEYLTIAMTDVQVTSVSTSVGAEEGAVVEGVVLVFGKVDLEYKPQKADGTLEAGLHFMYDLKAHEGG